MLCTPKMCGGRDYFPTGDAEITAVEAAAGGHKGILCPLIALRTISDTFSLFVYICNTWGMIFRKKAWVLSELIASRPFPRTDPGNTCKYTKPFIHIYHLYFCTYTCIYHRCTYVCIYLCIYASVYPS